MNTTVAANKLHKPLDAAIVVADVTQLEGHSQTLPTTSNRGYCVLLYNTL
jgi:hypothetical protein